MAEASMPIEVFCCYSRADEVWLRKLESHLSPLKRQGLISLWSDRLIIPGTNWAETIDQHLETASVILFLVSSDFLAPDYCYGVEQNGYSSLTMPTTLPWLIPFLPRRHEGISS